MSQQNTPPVDVYFTPQWVAEQAIRHIVPLLCPTPQTIIDPGTGQGAFLNVLHARYPYAHLTAIDVLDFKWPAADRSIHENFLTTEKLGNYNLAIGNPPFSLALEFIKRCLTCCDAVAMLLRQGFLSSRKRNHFFQVYRPSDVFMLAHRPSFVAQTSDKTDYCFVCWSSRNPGTTQLHWLPCVPIEQRR
jgi:hypothetical protein